MKTIYAIALLAALLAYAKPTPQPDSGPRMCHPGGIGTPVPCPQVNGAL